jgi:hypothetical protein
VVIAVSEALSEIARRISRDNAYSFGSFILLIWLADQGFQIVRGDFQSLLVLLLVMCLLSISLFYVEPRLKKTHPRRRAAASSI